MVTFQRPYKRAQAQLECKTTAVFFCREFEEEKKI